MVPVFSPCNYHRNLFFVARIICLAWVGLAFLPVTEGFAVDDSCEREVLKYCRGQGQTYQDAKRSMECLKKNRDKFLGECGVYIDEVLGGFESQRPCLEDSLRLCGIDLVKMAAKDPSQNYMEKVNECMIMKWDELSPGCREENRVVFDAIGLGEEEIKKEGLRLKERDKRRGFVWVKGKAVMAQAREGDLIWYAAKVREKKILDRYPFCPEVKGKGLEVQDAWRKGDCFYKVKAPWGGGVIEDLKKSGMLEKITDWGIRRQGLIKTDQIIREIVEKYTSNCPERFDLDVTYYSYQNEKFAVSCDGKHGYDTCQEGYLRSSYDDGFFGCVKYASCEETNPRYIDVGGGCFECEAGGCVDYERWVELGVGAICKVNYKDPAKTPACKPYQE